MGRIYIIINLQLKSTHFLGFYFHFIAFFPFLWFTLFVGGD
nr:MAG TPA: hypothetical protein [Caudoviricetes sp.]